MVVESILDSIKVMHGIGDDDTSFDKELVMHINGALMVMTELGVGPIAGYSITGKDQTWTEFLQGRTDLDLVFNDVYLRVKLIFDPPQNSFLVTAIERQIKECDWRIEAWHKPGTHIVAEEPTLEDEYD
jgi:hypothetical protein